MGAGILGVATLAARITHSPVRVRDGAGLVGPLVLPGVTRCLRKH